MGSDPFRQPFRDPGHRSPSEPPSSSGAPSRARRRDAHALVDATAKDSAVLPRNFDLPLEERMRALVQGPPAYMRRRREIEDLEAQIRSSLRAVSEGRSRDTALFRVRLEKQVRRLNQLIELHNRYYPGEANLPLDPTTGALLENGEPWAPLDEVTLEMLAPEAVSSRR